LIFVCFEMTIQKYLSKIKNLLVLSKTRITEIKILTKEKKIQTVIQKYPLYYLLILMFSYLKK